MEFAKDLSLCYCKWESCYADVHSLVPLQWVFVNVNIPSDEEGKRGFLMFV